MFAGTLLRALPTSLFLILAFPRPDLGLFSLIALLPLLSAIEGKQRTRAFLTGWAAGFVWFFFSLNWIAGTLREFGHIPFPLNQLVISLLCLILALHTGIFSFLVASFGRVSVWSVLLYPSFWVALEYFRSWVPVPFPWLLLGSAFWKQPFASGLFAISGVFGVSFAVVAVNTLLFFFYRSARDRKTGEASGWLAAAAGVVGVLILVSSAAARQDVGRKITVAVVQGNYAQEIKWEESYREEVISTYLSLSRAAASEGAELIVWPETAMPFYYQVEPDIAERLKKMVREEKVHLVFGSPAFDIKGSDLLLYNRAYHISPEGAEEYYDKIKLVPFGEYVPFQGLIPFVERIVPGVGDYAAGRWTAPFNTPVRSGALICYEISIPSLSRREVGDGARIILNLTNDAWFGRSWGPYQHLAMAALRAAENQVPIVRAANTGMSAVFDRSGRMVAGIGLFRKGYVLSTVEAGTGRSFYTKWGNLIVYLSVIVILFVALKRLVKRFWQP